MNNPIPALLLLASLAAPALSQAKDSLIPVDTLQEKLTKKRKASRLKSLKKAYQSLQDRKFAEAGKLAPLVIKDRDFADYGYWIAGTVALENARSELKARDFAGAQAAAQKAQNASIQILTGYPYSPFLKWVPRELAAAELVGGQARCAQKKWRGCRDSMENAFQRLVASGDLGTVRPDQLKAYREACSKEPTDRCGAWVSKLVSYFPRNTAEQKALTRPTAPSGPKGLKGHGRITTTYKSPDQDAVAFDGAMVLYFDKKFPLAAEAFRRFLDDYPRSAFRYRAQYWLGQALTQDQKHSDAQKIYEQLTEDSPLTYYGLLAALALGKDIGAAIDGTVPMAASNESALTALELTRLKRAETLISEGAPALAAFELRDVRARDPMSSPFLVYLAMLNDEASNHVTGFQLISELIQRSHPGVYSTFFLRLIFPMPYRDLIEAAAEEHKLDPILVLSLIKQESSFDSSAASGSGAQGLMQLMPATASDVNPELARHELVNAKTNIKTGVKYLSRLMSKFNGNIVLALAAYNAGATNVDRWIKASPPKRGMLEFIESIPFRETREYVAAIVRNYYWYSRKLDADPKPLTYFWNLYGPAERTLEAPKSSSEPPGVPASGPEAEED